jgi:hypothetical protein
VENNLLKTLFKFDRTKLLLEVIHRPIIDKVIPSYKVLPFFFSTNPKAHGFVVSLLSLFDLTISYSIQGFIFGDGGMHGP